MLQLSGISVSEAEEITEPVTLDEAKAWAMVDHDDHNALLTDMIVGAREDIEQETHLKLVESSVTLYAEAKKDGDVIGQLPYVIGMPESATVNLVSDGEADELQTVDEHYYLNGILKVASEGRYRVEYDITPVVPQGLKEAIMMLVAYRYNNRGDQSAQVGLPADIERKIARYRQVWL